MPRTVNVPKLRKHPKGSVVVLDGKYYYCGPYDSAEARQKYDRLIAEWLANDRRLPPPGSDKTSLTINDLLLAYWTFVKRYYVKDGRPTSEQDTIRQALRFVRKLYGLSPAAAFSPLALKAVRQAMIDHPITHKVKVKDEPSGEFKLEVRVLRFGLSRRVINKQIGRIKRMFCWAVENELLPANVHRALARVKGLRKDKTGAREKETVKPVEEARVQAVLPFVPATVRTMILVQQLCGGRPQDMVEMKPRDIDRSGEVWVYRPGRHKSEHHERERVVFLGPRAQALLMPHLESIGPDEFVFSPIRSETARLAGIRCKRGLPPNKPEKDRGKWALRDHYDVSSYRRAIRRGCKKASIPIWFPLQLRHSAGTAIRQKYGLEASQAVLGHSELSVTQVYSEVDLKTAWRVMAEIG
ncbi:MAG: tyrosine-type recombinase/integrase [Gemmataceae bacterium]